MTDWVDDVCRMALVWRTDEKSLKELYAPAVPRLEDGRGFVDAVAEWLRRHPDVIEAWIWYSQDKRASPNPWFRLAQAGGHEVGFYADDHDHDVRVYVDEVDACADFIYRDAQWIVNSRRVAPVE